MILSRGVDPRHPAHASGSNPPARRGRRVATAALAAGVGLAFVAGSAAYGSGVHRNAHRWAVDHTHPNYWRALRGPVPPTLLIDIGFRQFTKIKEKRGDALRIGQLNSSDEDFVPAQIRFGGKTIRVRLRLKGNQTDHLDTEKWSYRIHTRDGADILGMERFSIHHPAARRYINEWAVLENLRREGIIAPRYHFVSVTVNGDRRGLYALEEFFAPRLLEANGRPEGVLLIQDDALMRMRQTAAMTVDRNYGLRPVADLPGYYHHLVRSYAPGRVARTPHLASQRDDALRLLHGFREGALAASEIFDVALLARYLAIAELWQATHGMGSINSVFYFHPLSRRLEPVGFDHMALLDFRHYSSEQPSSLQVPWTMDALEDPAVAAAFVKELRRVTAPAYLEQLRQAIDAELHANLRLLHREWPTLAAPWRGVESRQRTLRAFLDQPHLVQAMWEPHSAASAGGVPAARLRVANGFPLPVEVLGFKVGGQFIEAGMAVSSPDSNVARKEGAVVLPARRLNTPPEYVEFTASFTSRADTDSPSVMVVHRLLGDTVLREVHARATQPSPVTTDGFPASLGLRDTLARHRFLEEVSDSLLRVRQGVWDVEDDLLVPEGFGLVLEPGTTLRFGPGAVLVVRGPLQMRGTAERPIHLLPQGDPWAGVLAVGASRESSLEHVTVEGAGATSARYPTLPRAALRFAGSPARVVSMSLLRSAADQTLVVQDAQCALTESSIAHTAGDAVVLERAQATISTTSLRHVGGHAVLARDSSVDLDRVKAVRVTGAVVAADAGSHVRASQMQASSVGVGVMSYGHSMVVVIHSALTRFDKAGLVALAGGAGPASITARLVTLGDGPSQALAEPGSRVYHGGRYIRTAPITPDLAILAR